MHKTWSIHNEQKKKNKLEKEMFPWSLPPLDRNQIEFPKPNLESPLFGITVLTSLLIVWVRTCPRCLDTHLSSVIWVPMSFQCLGSHPSPVRVFASTGYSPPQYLSTQLSPVWVLTSPVFEYSTLSSTLVLTSLQCLGTHLSSTLVLTCPQYLSAHLSLIL